MGGIACSFKIVFSSRCIIFKIFFSEKAARFDLECDWDIRTISRCHLGQKAKLFGFETTPQRKFLETGSFW